MGRPDIKCNVSVCVFVPRLNDIDRATNAKSEVEQKQRDEAKGRKDTNADWETKVTHNSANNVYQR